ncbi:hypothetical protein A3K79_05725 [Candidatus Bathyarchaeota archaeon RBG_13_46_16b]|nr:MAG: hypothetical protein A3K79_05725 [Candidatus Bathyarchaeota archaeon RBG_13_46_16b]
MAENDKIRERPNLSVLALVSFLASFMVARIFTTLSPSTVFISGGYHIHHYWYGLIILAIGGWLGISYENERINRVAAILFGAGGGIIGDEAGLLLTSEYWTGITFTLLIIFLAFASILILLFRFSRIILNEFSQFFHSQTSFYLGVFLATISVAFILETNDIAVMIASIVLTMIGLTIILSYFIHTFRTRKK